MKQLINHGWLFAKLPLFSSLEDAEKAAFTPVILPHDWLIGQDNLYESADAWYKRVLDADAEMCAGAVYLCFDGVYMDCDVLLNGEIIFTHPYGYTAFLVPLNGKLQPGRNTVLVHIRHRSPNSRWYSGSGIYRDVHLISLPVDHMVPDGLRIAEAFGDGRWTVTVTAEVTGPGSLSFSCILTDAEGQRAAEAEGTVQNGSACCTFAVTDGKPWSPDDPYLYTLSITYGKQTEVRKIGLRSFVMDPDHGLFLNGKHVKIRGVCLHHDLGALGAAFHEKAARRQLQLMKEMGANAVRTSHNPPASGFLDLCDEMGFLVNDEAFDMWERSKTEFDYSRFFSEWAARDTASWIRRDRCHPCVIFWSIGNEIADVHAGKRGTEITKWLSELVRLHDPDGHAAVTFGSNYMPWEGGQRCAGYLDAVGYNYGERCYYQHHAAHPEWRIYGSETGSLLSSRGVYHFPAEQSVMCEDDSQCSALGNSNTSWGAENLASMIVSDLQNPFSLGQFIWSGIDYIGEPTPYQARSCYFGQADTACFPKDSYYLFQSLWTEHRMVHIGVTWDWNPGQLIDVPVMSNCHTVELFLNGRSFGCMHPDPRNPEQCVSRWKIPFVPGTLTARAYDREGKICCEDQQVTPGEPERLVLQCENDRLENDGHDLIFVRVSVADAKGNPVRNARNRVSIMVSGGGYLLGTDNGDPTDPDSYRSGERRLFSGLLLLIIGSNGKQEDVCITAASPGCGETSLVVPVRPGGAAHTVSSQQNGMFPKPAAFIPVRKIELSAAGNALLTPENDECVFRYTILPAAATRKQLRWQVTNNAGIPVPYASLQVSGDHVTVKASGDGRLILRALWGEKEGRTDIISRLETDAAGFGPAVMDPFSAVPAGLYDISSGKIGTGNDKGIAFSEEGESMIGFRRIDFGPDGSDRLSATLYALNEDLYEIELLAGRNPQELETVTNLKYQKPSIWNVYQEEQWILPFRLTGVLSLCFRARKRIHFLQFRFYRDDVQARPEAAYSEISENWTELHK